jgi:hypothetical protein
MQLNGAHLDDARLNDSVGQAVGRASQGTLPRNKNTLPYAFRFQFIKSITFILISIGTK